MAQNPAKPTATEVASETPPKAEGDEPTFTVERLTAEAGELGLNPADVAGAFHGVSPTREVTVKDAKDRVRTWLRAPVKNEETV